tara:strand:- start:200327 stop:201985 length:1659 start_codon:yes stop_codon:yes gene_type:complete
MDKKVTKTFCFIQITRLGDLIQTCQVAKELRAQRPELRLVLIARKQFAAPLEFLLKDLFDKVYNLDFKYNVNKATELSSIDQYITSFVNDVNQEKIDVSINFSYSKSSNYLHTLLDSRYKLGPSQNDQNQTDIFDPWSTIVQANVMRGPFNPFNLVDIYKRVVGVDQLTPETFELKDKSIISIHPFASSERKSWSIKKWKEVVIKVLRANTEISINIVGAKNEAHLAKELFDDPVIKFFEDRIKNLVGKTSIEELFVYLQNSSHFLGHDSMTGHLAKLANCPTLTVSLGTVRPQETTPYGHHSYNIVPKTKCFPCFPDETCPNYKCHSDISYQATSQIVNMFINNEDINEKSLAENVNLFHLNGIEVFKSEFTSANFFNLKQASANPSDAKSIIRLLLRIIYLYKFSEIEEDVKFPKLTQDSYSQLYASLEGVQHLFELSEFGKKYSKDVILELAKDSPSINLIKKLTAKIDEIDKLQEMVLQPFPLLTPYVEFFQVMKGNLKGNNLVELSESNYILYNDYSVLTSTLNDLLTKILSEHKINKKTLTNEAKE